MAHALQRFTAYTLLLTLLTTLILPQIAEARAGGGYRGGSSRSMMSSPGMGSRGSRTYENNSARPIERSIAPRTTAPRTASPAQTMGQPTPLNPSYAQPSFFQRNPLMASFGAALAGSWIGSMLFGHSTGHAASGNQASSANAASNGSIDPAIAGSQSSGGSSNMLITILIIAAIGFLAFKLFRRPNGNAAIFSPVSSTAQNNVSGFSGYAEPAPFERGQDITLSPNESAQFATLLTDVQSAWSSQNLDALKRLCTPEMLGYFRNILNQNISQSVENKVENVTVTQVQIQEAWQEDGMEYATALLKWTAKDYTVSLQHQPYEAGYLVEGDLDHLIESSEVWTYVRYASGSQWLLSAIQQL